MLSRRAVIFASGPIFTKFTETVDLCVWITDLTFLTNFRQVSQKVTAV